MKLLSRFKLRTKLGLLLAMSVLTIVATIANSASTLRERMTSERIDKLAAVVDSTISLAAALQKREAGGELTHAQAIDVMRDNVHAMRFENGTGYIAVEDSGGILRMHGTTPALEGKMNPAKDLQGRSVKELIDAVLDKDDSGIIHYVYSKPGESAPQPKVSFVKRFTPWHLIFFAGAYTDDLDAVFQATILRMSLFTGAIMVVMMLAAWAINRDISGSLGRLGAAMNQLASGDISTVIPGLERRDEVGGMAELVMVFKTHMLQAQQLEAEKGAVRQRAEQDKRLALAGMAERIETETNQALQQVAARADLMAATADQMHASASRTGASANTAAAAAAEALANVQAVAGAAEQLAGSISEISGKVGQSTAMVARAVGAGMETRRTIEALNKEVGEIGAVADMISEIAAKTNLLALNATIEAARAGEAGKGFAVVASEVKALATQTARSTQEIARHINQVRSATGAAVVAVGQIEDNIGEINAVAGWIATAVEQQGAAAAQIADSVGQTAAAADQMTIRVGEVSAEALETGRQSTVVGDNAAALIAAMKELKLALVRVVRTATTEVDRRVGPRHQVDLPCRLTVAGQQHTSARVIDLSLSGARITGSPSWTVGTHGTLALDGLNEPLPFTTRSLDGATSGVAFKLDEAGSAALDNLLQRLVSKQAA